MNLGRVATALMTLGITGVLASAMDGAANLVAFVALAGGAAMYLVHLDTDPRSRAC